MSQSADLSFKDLFLLLWRGKWIVLPITVLSFVIGSLYVQTVKPVYQVDAMLQIESKDGKGGGAFNALDGMENLFQVNSPAETEIQILKSRMVLGEVVRQRGLDIKVDVLGYGPLKRLLRRPRPQIKMERLDVREEMEGMPLVLTIGDKGTYTVAAEGGPVVHGRVGAPLDSAANSLHLGLFVPNAKDAPAGTQFRIERAPLLGAVAGLGSRLSATEQGKSTGIVRMTFTGGDPREAARLLNDIANAYVRQNVERKSAEAQKTLEFLQGQLPEIKAQLEVSENKLNAFRIKVGSLDLSQEARLALEQQVAVQQKVVALQQKKKEVLQLFKADHPNVLTIDSLMALAQKEVQQQDSLVKGLPEQQQEIVRMMRDVQVNTDLYTGLLNNVQQLKVVKAGEIGNVRLVDAALPNWNPIKPQKRTIRLAFLFGGFFLGAGLVIARWVLNAGVEDPRQIETALGLAVYANVTHSEAQEKLEKAKRRGEKGMHLLAKEDPDDLAIESLRSLRTTLHFSMLDAADRVLLLVGPSPALGKSFVSANFAAILAQAGHRVLLVDADLRRGKLHRIFGTGREQGFSELLTGTVAMDAAVHVTEVPGLFFVPTGALPPNPAELLMHANCGKVIAGLKEQFDYVIMDTAPVLAVTDAAILGKLAGTTLMVLRHGKHPMNEIEACHKRLAQAEVAVKGVVFNDVKLDSGVGTGYGTAAYQYSYKKDRGA